MTWAWNKGYKVAVMCKTGHFKIGNWKIQKSLGNWKTKNFRPQNGMATPYCCSLDNKNSGVRCCP